MSKNILENNALSGSGSIFKSTENRADKIIDGETETVVHICLDDLHPPEFHPFHVNEVICCKGYKIRTYYNTGSYAIFEV